MSFIKNNLKDFWLYYKAVFNSPSKDFKKYFPALIIVMTVLMASAFANLISGLGFNILVIFPAAVAMRMGYCVTNKPSLVSVAPFSPKQRVVFSYLSMILRSLIIAVLYLSVMILTMLIIALGIFIFTGENVFVIEDISYRVSVWAGLYEAVSGLFLFFSVYAISHVESTKHRNIASVCWGVFCLIMIVILRVYTNRVGESYESEVLSGGFYKLIDHLDNPWLPATLAAVLAAIALAVSIYLSIKVHKSGKV